MEKYKKLEGKKILITGANGLVGTALKALLEKDNYVVGSSSKSYDLRCKEAAEQLIKDFRPEYIFHFAARVGGLGANLKGNGIFFYENVMINTNLLEAAKNCKVKKVLSLLSTCVYPDGAKLPLEEENIQKGEPHSSNFGYAYAKRLLDVQSRAYREQYGCNFITVIPNNIFGENDNYDLEGSHVIPALIRKFYEAKHNIGGEKDGFVYLWGDGSPVREFTYSKDLVKILKFVMEVYNEPCPINVGNVLQYSICEVAEELKNISNYPKIYWDIKKPSGQFQKPSSNTKITELLSEYDFEINYTEFSSALKKSYDWFAHNYPNVRGV